MAEVGKSKIVDADLDGVVQEYFRQRHINFKPSDIEGLIKQFDLVEKRDQASAARRV
jgi:hypothetical protein